MQLRRDAQVKLHVERVMVGDEGFGRGAALDRVQHRRLDFDIAPGRQPCAHLGDNAAAERSLQEAAGSSNADLGALGKFALASVYRSEHKDQQAIDLYKQLIDKPTIVVSKATAQLELAGFYESQQKPDDAKKIYDQVAKDNPSTEAASIAQRRKAALK